MKTEAMFSSKRDDWETPQLVYDLLDADFHFTLDPCASPENRKCDRYFTKEVDGLKQSWKGETVFCNPPYGREIGKWVKKAHDECRNGDCTVVMLIPARTDTSWFHDYIYHEADEIRFMRGRIKFSGSKNNAPFPVMLVVFR